MPSHGPAGDPHNLNNPWRDFLNEEPDIAYNALRPQTGSNSFLDYWRTRAGQVRNDYLGVLGQTALRGEAPNLEFPDFLEQFPFLSRYAELGPRQRGVDTRRIAPGLRWLV